VNIRIKQTAGILRVLLLDADEGLTLEQRVAGSGLQGLPRGLHGGVSAGAAAAPTPPPLLKPHTPPVAARHLGMLDAALRHK